MKITVRSLFQGYAWLAMVLFVILFAANLILLPNFLAPLNIISTMALAAPLVIASMAVVPSMLSGGGGIDISVGSVMGIVNVGMFTFASFFGIQIQNPVMAISFFVFIGALIGSINGVLITVVRLQPIVVTLGIYLILTGIGLHLMPNPTGIAPKWLKQFAGYIGPIPGPLLVVGILLMLWWLLTRLPYHRNLLAVGGDERAAYSAGLPVVLIRIIAYILGGILAAVAGLSLTGFVGSGDPNLGSNYVLLAIAAATLGGTSLAGGRGGMAGAIFGALDIFLIEKVLTAVQISSFWFRVAYGVILLMALISNSLVQRSSDKYKHVGA